MPGCYKEGGQWDMAGTGVCYDENLVKPELRFYSIANHSDGYPYCDKGCLDDADCQQGLLRCAIREGLEDVHCCRWGSNSSIEDFYASVPNSHNYWKSRFLEIASKNINHHSAHPRPFKQALSLLILKVL